MLMGLIPDAEVCDPRFLFWYLEALKDRLLVPLMTGTANVTLKPADLAHVRVTLPALDLQRHLAAHLDALDAKVESLSQLVGETTSVLDALLLGIFLKLTANVPTRRMHDVAPLVRRPVAIDPTCEYPELGIRSFGRGTFHKPAVNGAAIGTKRLYWIRPGDLVFSNVFAWEGAMAMASASDAGRVGSHRFMTCEPAPDLVLGPFLNFYFHTPEGLSAIGAASPEGAGRNRTLSVRGLGLVEVPCPDLASQRRFVAVAEVASQIRRELEQTADEGKGVFAAALTQGLKAGANLDRVSASRG